MKESDLNNDMKRHLTIVPQNKGFFNSFIRSIGKKEEQERVYAALINTLSLKEKEVLKIMSRPSMTFSRCAQLLGMSKGNVSTYWKRIKEKMK